MVYICQDPGSGTSISIYVQLYVHNAVYICHPSYLFVYGYIYICRQRHPCGGVWTMMGLALREQLEGLAIQTPVEVTYKVFKASKRRFLSDVSYDATVTSVSPASPVRTGFARGTA